LGKNGHTRKSTRVSKRELSARKAPFFHKKTGETMSKRKNKNQRQQENQNHQRNHFELRHISPLTPNQQLTFDSYDRGMNLMLHGFAGTGKTFISLYLALNEVLSEQSIYDKVIIIRSVVPSRDIGFLPGNTKEKIRVYEEPYKEICDELFGRGDGYDILKMRGIVHFTSTSFLRGITFNNAIVIVDELQNLGFPELDTVMTRMGDQSKIVFCGDFRQTDLTKESEKGGLNSFINITKRMNRFSYIEFEKTDIVRSSLVRDYIIERTAYLDRN
jgi:predicted ribonuclease YlaK